MDYQNQYHEKLCEVDDVLTSIRSGEQICTAGVLCEPLTFLERFHEIVPRLEDVLLLKGRNIDVPFLQMPDLHEHVTVIGHLFDAALRRAMSGGAITHIPSNLHDFMPNRVAFRSIDTFIAMATPMDEFGNFYICGCGMWEYTAATTAKRIILEINPELPRFHGSACINISTVDMLYEAPRPITEYPRSVPTNTDRIIGELVASLVNDGDCIQLGIGGMPEAVGLSFMNKHDLGLHTELFTPVMGELMEAGVITSACKNVDRCEHVGTFVMGDRKLYHTLSADPRVRFADVTYTNNPAVIASIDNMVSVNAAMEIDLTGQICSESIGPVQFSGTGGAFDFAYGTLNSKGGRYILAMTSTTKNYSISKIKTTLTPGAVVSVPRNLADIVVTEYGIAYLRGRTVRERTNALISIAHPDFRDQLRHDAKELNFI